MSLEEWFESHSQKKNSPWNPYHNPMVFQLSHYSSPFFESNHTERMTRKDLEIAKRNLESFAVVGLTERMEDTIELISDTFGVPVTKSGQANAGLMKRDQNFSKEIIELIRQRNELDIELYEHAKRLFEKQFKEYKRRST